jgi:hypothetical protein
MPSFEEGRQRFTFDDRQWMVCLDRRIDQAASLDHDQGIRRQ